VNNLGQLLKDAQNTLLTNLTLAINDYAHKIRDFSESIKKATVDSAKKATVDVLAKEAEKFRIMPARPLVLGGDDVTFIVRGDLALDFTKVFLAEFENRSNDELTQLKESHPELKNILPEQLTACAGIAYVKASQPFYQGYHLADSLCKYAKKCSKNLDKKTKLVPSSLAFHRMSSNNIDKYETVLTHELTISNGFHLSMQPYFINPSTECNDCPNVKDLQELLTLLNKQEVSHGTLREFLSLLEVNKLQAEKVIQRWYDNLKNSDKVKLFEHFKHLLGDLIKEPYKYFDSPIRLIDNQKRTPIGDALVLLQISKGSDYVPSDL